MSSPRRLLSVCSANLGWRQEHKPTPRGHNRPHRHRDPCWSKLRGAKVFKVDVPDYEFQRRAALGKASPAEVRDELKKSGEAPLRERYTEKPLYLSCTGGVLDDYVPPEGDGKASVVSTEGAKQRTLVAQRKTKTLLAVRKIRKYDEAFDPRTFVEQAQDVYIAAHKLLAGRDYDGLHEYVTEKVYPEMKCNVEKKTIYWQFVKSLEPPRAVSVRVQDIITKDNHFAQIIVRMHTQQILAVYDRFGRLLYGNPIVAKDTLEYVVFEKHLSNVYGKWRIHAKIIPDWVEEKPVSKKTYVVFEDQGKEKKEEQEDEQQVANDGIKEEGKESEVKEATIIYDRFGKAIAKHQ